MNIHLENIPTELLVKELIDRYGQQEAAWHTVREVDFYETIVPVGDDNICSLCLSYDDMDVLEERIEAEEYE
jgi:hypothetical protein